MPVCNLCSLGGGAGAEPTPDSVCRGPVSATGSAVQPSPGRSVVAPPAGGSAVGRRPVPWDSSHARCQALRGRRTPEWHPGSGSSSCYRDPESAHDLHLQWVQHHGLGLLSRCPPWSTYSGCLLEGSWGVFRIMRFAVARLPCYPLLSTFLSPLLAENQFIVRLVLPAKGPLLCGQKDNLFRLASSELPTKLPVLGHLVVWVLRRTGIPGGKSVVCSQSRTQPKFPIDAPFSQKSPKSVNWLRGDHGFGY